MQTNTPNLPSWAESMVEPVARAMAPIVLPYIEGYEEVPPEHIWTRPRYVWLGMAVTKIATAALAEALPMVAERYARMIQCKAYEDVPPGDVESPCQWQRRCIATAIRREVGLSDGKGE